MSAALDTKNKEQAMKKNTILTSLAVVALSFTCQVQAQDALVDHVFEACKVDIESFCSQVTPGQGRLLHCAAAHEDKLSGQCSYALFQAATVMEQMAAAIVYVAQQCKTDIQTLCGAVKEGDGRILMCLEEQAEGVSDACKQAVSDVTSD
jgi:hypothetical protein